MEFPAEYRPLLTGAPVYDSSCSPAARVYYIDRDGGYYLKTQPVAAGSLRLEAEKGRFFFEKGLGAEVLSSVASGADAGRSIPVYTSAATNSSSTNAATTSQPIQPPTKASTPARIPSKIEAVTAPSSASGRFIFSRLKVRDRRGSGEIREPVSGAADALE